MATDEPQNPITRFREKRGLSRRDLALLLELSTAGVGAWERGDYCPPPTVLEKLKVYGLHPKRAEEEWRDWRKRLTNEQHRRLLADNGQTGLGID